MKDSLANRVLEIVIEGFDFFYEVPQRIKLLCFKGMHEIVIVFYAYFRYLDFLFQDEFEIRQLKRIVIDRFIRLCLITNFSRHHLGHLRH